MYSLIQKNVHTGTHPQNFYIFYYCKYHCDRQGSAPSASASATGTSRASHPQMLSRRTWSSRPSHTVKAATKVRKRRGAPCRSCRLRHERRARVPVGHFRLKLSEPHHSGHQGEHVFINTKTIHIRAHPQTMSTGPGRAFLTKAL